MRKLFVTSILVLTFCATMFAQTNKISPCPTIDVSSAPYITDVGDPITFVASLNNATEKLDLKYIWTVSGGEIIEGQGNLIVKVKQKVEDFGQTLTATFEIIGLPKGCANTASASAPLILERKG